MKLYKFRSLTGTGGAKSDLEKAKEILDTGEFWHSAFSDLNDPVEGSFTIFPNVGKVDRDLIDRIYSEKNEYKICSFSGEAALQSPIMWGYYANGFKGVAIEIEVGEKNIERVKYVKNIFHVSDRLSPEEKAKQILTRKLLPWRHEKEFRSLKKIGEPYQVGTIKALYFGAPYGNAANGGAIYAGSRVLRRYKDEREELLSIAKDKGYSCHHMGVVQGKVVNVPNSV